MLKKVLKISSLTTAAFLTVQTVQASAMGVCTHMAHTYGGTNNPMDQVIAAAKDVGAEWIRDELRWGWGMQTQKGGPFRMPAEDWVDDVENAGLNSLVILGFGNSVYSADNAFPTLNDPEYFNAFLDYTEYVATTTRGKIEAYELWNEPNNAAFIAQLANPSAYSYTYTVDDYAELMKQTYMRIKPIVNDAKIVGGAVLLWDAEDYHNWINWIDRLLAVAGPYMDALSIHNYEYGDDTKNMELVLKNEIEPLLTKHNFTGEVWITETGDSSATSKVSEAEQAERAIKRMVCFDKWLASSGRDGLYFQYELKDSLNHGADDSESHFGLYDYNFNIKPAGRAVKTFNKSTKGRNFVSFTTPKTSGNILKSYYGKLATYSDGNNKTTYVAWDMNNRSDASMSLSLTGDYAKIYDYDGTLLASTTQKSYNLSVDKEPKFVVCGAYESEIDKVYHDNLKCELTISGKYDCGDTITVEVLKNGAVELTKNVPVTNGAFEATFPVMGFEGDYIVRAGYPEVSAFGKTEGWAEKNITIKLPGEKENAFNQDASVIYSQADRTVSVSGSLNDYYSDETLILMAVAEGANLNELSKEEIAYLGTIKINSNASFNTVFKMPNDAYGKYNVYMRSSYSQISSDNILLPENEYVLVGSFTAENSQNVISAQASVRNLSSSAKKASIIIAQYDASGKMINVTSKDFEVNAHKSANSMIEYSTQKASNAALWKAFIWSDVDSIKPLAEAVLGN